VNAAGAGVCLQSCCRHRNSWLACIPASRATSEATAPGSSAAATIRSFSARDHRRRRCTDVITSTYCLVISASPRITPRTSPQRSIAQGGPHRTLTLNLEKKFKESTGQRQVGLKHLSPFAVKRSQHAPWRRLQPREDQKMPAQTIKREMQWSRATEVTSAALWLIVALFFVLASLYVPA
jgi:hypothetical protein